MRAVVVWGFRVVWAALALTLAPAIGAALEDRSRSVQVTGTTVAWVVWGVTLCAALVPSTVSLTVVRALVPCAVVAALVASLAGAGIAEGALGTLSALAAVALAYSAELGSVFVQASAYGDERRFPLRPPASLLVVLPAAWIVAVASLMVGVLALAARAWVLGVLVTAEGAVLAWFLAPRLHRLSRRWLVLVPAGVVLHDHVVLAETVMVPRADLVGVALAEQGTSATDLTGPALGPALEVRVRNPLDVALAALPRRTPRRIQVQSLLVAPSRPGRTLAAVHAGPLNVDSG
jgi:hypothetical protein